MEQQDGIRLEQFRQLKREARSSDGYLIVGIDVSKDRHHACFRAASGRILLKRLVFENSYEGFERLLNQADVLRLENGLREVVFGMEPTGNYHKPLGEFLIRRLALVVLVSNVAAKENRKSLDGRWDKHDEKDAANVADLVSQGKFLFYEYPEPRIKELRVLLALKRRLKRQEHGYRVRIRNHLVAKYFPELDRYFDQSEKYSLTIVRWCLDPRSLSGYEFEEFVRMVAPQMRSGQQSGRLRTILQRAQHSIGCEMGPGAEFEARVMVEVEKSIKARLTGLTHYEVLSSIPGFGPYICAVVLSAIGNPHRFENRSQLLRLAGLDLSANRSGKRSPSAVPVISKRGKADLRYALYQAALVASSFNHHVMAYYRNLLTGREREPGIRTKMRVKLAAKLLIIAWTLMKNKEPFNPERLKMDC
jgi:transposase